MFRRALPLFFAFLLLGMQQLATLHALEHDGQALHRPHDQGLQIPVDDTACAICALFAGGSTAATPADGPAFSAPAVGDAAPQSIATPHAASAPSYYRSRAPPAVL